MSCLFSSEGVVVVVVERYDMYGVCIAVLVLVY